MIQPLHRNSAGFGFPDVNRHGEIIIWMAYFGIFLVSSVRGRKQPFHSNFCTIKGSCADVAVIPPDHWLAVDFYMDACGSA